MIVVADTSAMSEQHKIVLLDAGASPALEGHFLRWFVTAV